MKLYAAIKWVGAQGMYQQVIKFLSEDKAKVEEYEKQYGETHPFCLKLIITEIETDKEISLETKNNHGNKTNA